MSIRAAQDFADAHHDKLPVTEETYWRAYKAYARASNRWGQLGFGSTWAMTLIHHHNETLKPGSREWRPQRIIDAIVTQA